MTKIRNPYKNQLSFTHEIQVPTDPADYRHRGILHWGN